MSEMVASGVGTAQLSQRIMRAKTCPACQSKNRWDAEFCVARRGLLRRLCLADLSNVQGPVEDLGVVAVVPVRGE